MSINLGESFVITVTLLLRRGEVLTVVECEMVHFMYFGEVATLNNASL